MKKGDEKFKVAFKNISTLLLFVAFSVSPITTFAASSSLTNSVDNIRGFLATIERQVADYVQILPSTAGPQANLSKELAKYRGFLDNLDSYSKSVESLLNIGKGTSATNIISQIPQLQSLATTIKSFQGGGGAENILSTITQLQSLGVPGLTQASSEITKALDVLSNVDKGIGGITTKVADVLTSAQELQTAVQKVSVASGFGGATIGATQGATQGAIADAQKKLTEAVGVVEGLATGVSKNLDNAADPGALQDTFTDSEMDQEKSVCDNPPASFSGGGAGNGVPTIEQSGPLLDFTGRLVELNSAIKTVNKETCYKIEQLWKKEFELDPKVKEDAQKALEETKKQLDKQFKEGRKPSNDLNAKKSFSPTISEFVKEETDAARNKYLAMLEKSNLPTDVKEVIKRTAQEDIELSKNEEAGYKARTNPTFNTKDFVEKSKGDMKPDDFFSGLIQASDPRNTPLGQYISQIFEKERLVKEAEKNARDEYIAGQGIIGLKQCTETTPDGKNCIKWEIKTPAKLYGELQTEYYTNNVKQTATANNISSKKMIEENVSRKDVEKTEEALGSAGGDSIGGFGGTGTSGGTTGGGNGGTGSYTGGYTEGGTNGGTTGGGDGGFNLGDLLDLFGNITGEEETSNTTITIPLPIVSFDQNLENLGNGIFRTKIAWSADLAVSCRASNDWITYGDKATTTSQILRREDSDTGEDDQTLIYHPAGFSFSVDMTTGAVPRPVPVQTIASTIVKEGTGFKQTIRYTPNLTGVIEGDTLMISVNNDQIITVPFEGETEAQLIAKIKSAMDGINPATEKGKIYSGITKTLDNKTLVLVKSVTNIPSSSVYEIACKNVSNKETVKKITVEFFK